MTSKPVEHFIGHLTIQEPSREVYTHISIPCRLSSSLNRPWDLLCLHLLCPNKYAILIPKANDDFWHTKEKRLNPKFHEFPLEG